MGQRNPAEVAAEIIGGANSEAAQSASAPQRFAVSGSKIHKETYTIEHVNGEDSRTRPDYVDVSGMEQPVQGGVMIGAPTTRELLEAGIVITAFQTEASRVEGDARVWVARVGLDEGKIVTE